MRGWHPDRYPDGDDNRRAQELAGKRKPAKFLAVGLSRRRDCAKESLTEASRTATPTNAAGQIAKAPRNRKALAGIRTNLVPHRSDARVGDRVCKRANLIENTPDRVGPCTSFLV